MHSLPQSLWHYFPYPSFKPNQEQLLSVVYDAFKGNSNAIIDGASGLGKTVGALAGGLQACKEHDRCILYTARTYKELDRVVEELVAINGKEKVSGISIRGRSEMCVNDAVLRLSRDSRTLMELCSDLVESGKCPYYSNVDEDRRSWRTLREEILAIPTPAFELIAKSRQYEMCPYEITRLLLPQVDVIALSYAYLFNRRVRDNFLKKLGGSSRSITRYSLILDEAHNLPEIANEYESDLITSLSIASAAEEADRYGKASVRRFCDQLAKIISRTEMGEHVTNLMSLAEEAAKNAHLGDPLPIFLEESHAFGESVKMHLLSKGRLPRSHIHRLGEFFLRAIETSGKRDFVHIIESVGNNLTAVPIDGERNRVNLNRLEIVSLDPRTSIAEIIETVPSTVSMSGTLESMEAYQEMVGLPKDTVKITLPSPFGDDQTLFLACKGLSTHYERRCEDIYRKMVARISEVVQSTPGNSGIFCSSYEVMEGLISCGLESSFSKPTYVERQRARSTDQDRLIEEFKAKGPRGGAVLVGVMGGRFSEGEDYPGDELNSVVIVGVPYPKPTAKIESQIMYYDSAFPGKGKEYGYVLPAMRKASQAAGRPFRNQEDRGVVIFMDYRYSTRYLSSHLPDWIRTRIRSIEESEPLEPVVRGFYSLG